MTLNSTYIQFLWRWNCYWKAEKIQINRNWSKM